MPFRLPIVLVLCLGFSTGSAALEPGAGNIKGRFVLDGDLPETTPTVLPGGRQIPDESVVVDPETHGVANGFAWIRNVDVSTLPKWQSEPPAEIADLDVRGDSFKPHALIARTQQKLRLRNADPHAHYVFTNPPRGGRVNETIAANDRVGVVRTFNGSTDIVPFPVGDHQHVWMRAYMLVLNHPFGTVSRTSGEFVIENLPAGEHTLRLWHERTGFVEKGRIVTVHEGETTDLGEIRIEF